MALAFEKGLAIHEAEIVSSYLDGKDEGKAEGRAEGKAERDMEIALKAFAGQKRSKNISDTIDMLKEFGIGDDIIESARKQTEAEQMNPVDFVRYMKDKNEDG